MQSRMTTDFALQALLSCCLAAQTKAKGHDPLRPRFPVYRHRVAIVPWQTQLGCQHEPSWNCHDNAVAESFFQLLKRERIRRRTYLTRDAARQDVFDYIEMFYNPTRKHTNNGMLSPVDYEIKQRKMNEAGV